MKKLSINIPTYNRESFLEKNLINLVNQITDNDLHTVVEINISDNASTDNTRILCKRIKELYPNVDIAYHCNDTNLGPDLNFIKAMEMANGEYSILFGDDDYLEQGAIVRLLDLFSLYPEVTFFLSNRISINEKEIELGRTPFLKSDVDTEVFDFALKNDMRAYFSLANDHGAILTFISSVAYKTNIINEVGNYDERCIGSNYSFLNYWWRAILKGKKLMYVNEYLVKATTVGSTNNNYGKGLKRLLVDTDGLTLIANYSIENLDARSRFMEVVRRCISPEVIYRSYFANIKEARTKLFPSMEKCGWDESTIAQWKLILSFKQSLFACMHYLLPNRIKRSISRLRRLG